MESRLGTRTTSRLIKPDALALNKTHEDIVLSVSGVSMHTPGSTATSGGILYTEELAPEWWNGPSKGVLSTNGSLLLLLNQSEPNLELILFNHKLKGRATLSGSPLAVQAWDRKYFSRPTHHTYFQRFHEDF